MSKRPNTKGIEQRLSGGKDFELTRGEYIRITGVDIPQDPSYTAKRSAVAKLANEYEYEIWVVSERLIFKKKA